MLLYEKLSGSLYAMAAGDALGISTSFLTPDHIRNVWGRVDAFYHPEPGHIFHAEQLIRLDEHWHPYTGGESIL
jgi:ADP-ribosylglycohydrolase